MVMAATAAIRVERNGERFSFLQKLVAGVALVAGADWLFFPFPERIGSALGGYALALLLTLWLVRPTLRRGAAAIALAVAGLFALALADAPSLLAAALFWTAASLAVLLPGTAFDDGWRWAERLLFHWVTLAWRPVEDAWRIRAARHRAGAVPIARNLPVLWLPLLGTAMFLALFAAANPLIQSAFDQLEPAALLGGLSITRIAFWILVTMLVWGLLRPRRLRLGDRSEAAGEPVALPGVSFASVTLSLFAFNLVFAVENGLDIAFLWSGAPLPGKITLADYAHRGAYPLIATALLAGLFVLVTMRPGSQLAESPTVRRLVYLWIGQNVLLVASSILRTMDYVDSYSLTRLRIGALAWMAWVGVGLVLICWRLWRRRSAAWLINTNLAAAALLLLAASFVDLGSVAAQWNVGHAREVGGRGVQLDLCYLTRLGDSALLPLVSLESRPLPPALRDRASWARNLAMDRLEQRQRDWRGWTWRGSRRLAEAERRTAERRLPRFHAARRECEGIL
jgi:hypothetical protein